MDYTPTNPYVTDVEIQAWGEGLTFALHGDKYLDRNEANPYTSGDTCVAWAQGYDDALYEPAPFNPSELLPQEVQSYVSVAIYHDRDPSISSITRGTYLLWSWTGGTLFEDSGRQPVWKDNRWQDRSIKLDTWSLRGIIQRGIGDPTIVGPGSYELPCPPYEFTYESGGMRMTAGTFTKYGDKEDFQAVITSMQDALNDAPETLDCSDVTINLSVSARASASWVQSIPVSDMLAGEDQMDGDEWNGTEDELHDAVVSAIDNLDSGELMDYYTDIDYEVDEYSEFDVEAQDLTYDLNDVN